MASPTKALLLHPKKSFFFFGLTNICAWYTYDYTVTNDIMINSCKQAAVFGDERLRYPLGKVKHITVILNPIAGGRKSKKLYQKWVEPILNLGGIKVSLVETQSPNQAYELMKIMSNCDAVAIVGGDGTIHEALNGLLDRSDASEVASKLPIGIIPTGKYNSIARYVHQGNMNYRNQKEFLIFSTLRLVESCTTKYDVLKIKSPHEDLNADSPSSTYALRDVRYGIYQDNFFKTSGHYNFETYIKPHLLRFKRFFGRSKYPEPRIGSISYTEPCTGCSRCFERHRLNASIKVDTSEKQSANKRWWSLIGPSNQTKPEPNEDELNQLEIAKRDNPECGKWKSIGDTSAVSDIRACMMGENKVRLSIARDRELEPSDVIETQDVCVRLSPELDSEFELAKQTKLNEENVIVSDADKQAHESTSRKENEKKQTQFLIDGQPVQAHSIEITAIGNAVTISTGPPKII